MRKNAAKPRHALHPSISTALNAREQPQGSVREASTGVERHAFLRPPQAHGAEAATATEATKRRAKQQTVRGTRITTTAVTVTMERMADRALKRASRDNTGTAGAARAERPLSRARAQVTLRVSWEQDVTPWEMLGLMRQ